MKKTNFSSEDSEHHERERERERDLGSAFFKKLVNNIIVRRGTILPFGVPLPFSM
jgi:hypothetical protein